MVDKQRKICKNRLFALNEGGLSWKYISLYNLITFLESAENRYFTWYVDLWWMLKCLKRQEW